MLQLNLLSNHKNKIVFFGYVVLITITIYIGYLFYNHLDRFMKKAEINEIYISGVNNQLISVIYNDLSPLIGDSIWELDINSLAQYLEITHKWIAKAHVYRDLNGILKISIFARNPYFIWLNDNDEYQIITHNYQVLKSVDFLLEGLAVIEKGQTALQHMSDLELVLYKDIDILHNIKKLVYKDYRWDIVLKNDIIIKLPSQDIEIAYSKVLLAHYNYGILNKDINYVDATSVRKLFVMPNKR